MTSRRVQNDPQVRTYRGRTLEELLPQIRAELGPDAVVVRQREGLMGGIGGFFQQRFVEVEARLGSKRVDLYDDEPAVPRSGAGAGSPGVEERDRAAAAAAAPAAPTPAPPAAPPRARLSAAELLAQATGASAGDPRTPAEILRERGASFARQLAVAEEHAEPVVTANGAAAAGTPGAAEQEPVPFPRPAPPAPDGDEPLPPAARASATARAPAAPRARRGAAARARRAASRATKPRAARRPRATKPVKESEAIAAETAKSAAPAAPRPAASALAEPRAAAPAAAEPAARTTPSGPELPPSGVGPQTTQALELAAALAAKVTAPRPVPEHAPTDADPLADHVPAAPVLPLAPAKQRAALNPPRRTLLGRRRAVPMSLRSVTGSVAAQQVVGTLAERGIEPDVAHELIVDAAAHVLPFTPDGDLRTAARTVLARYIPTPELPAVGGRAIAFVGAGGAGKTRCVAGLAAAYAGGSTLPTVCMSIAPTDGGAELTALLRAHGVRVETVDARSAARRIAEARADAIVVVDTPPVSPSDPAGIAALADQLTPLELDETHLVMPAMLSSAVAQQLVERLAPLRPTGIAMTHADATGYVGAVVELACATRLPLSYVNSGVALPGALAPADPDRIAEWLLP